VSFTFSSAEIGKRVRNDGKRGRERESEGRRERKRVKERTEVEWLVEGGVTDLKEALCVFTEGRNEPRENYIKIVKQLVGRRKNIRRNIECMEYVARFDWHLLFQECWCEEG
jgi:hypothetical protein